MKTITVRLVSLSALIFLILFSGCASSNLEFKKDLWLNSDKCEQDNPRHRMIENLKTDYLKIGMQKDDATNLLGNETETNNSLSYIIGDDGVDCLILELDFENQKLKEIKIIQG